MKTKLQIIVMAVILTTNSIFGQAPNLGSAANFVLFSSNGAVSNTGISRLTGNVGTNNGSSTAFGNVDGVMHDGDGASLQCATDLSLAYNQLNATIPGFFPASLLGNGQILNAGVYSIGSPTTLNLDLTLDAQGDPNAVFIFQINGSFSTNASAKVHLVNGALACNVFWKVEGLVSMASGTTMRGTIIANNAAINMSSGDTLEGRALSTTGAITIDGILAYTPIGCGSPYLTGPSLPILSSASCYALFSLDGPVTNTGITNVLGDVGTNNGLTTGFNPLFVTGQIHPIPDASTLQCANDLSNVYTYLNTLPYDINLLYPAQFGNNLVLTPHTYLMNGAVTFTDTLYLNGEGNADAVFVIQINGALSTSTYSKVFLINGTQAKNVYWKVDGAVDINDYSIFRGTIVCNNGAIILKTGVLLEGRALTTTGALNTNSITVIIPPGCPSTSSPLIITEPITQTECNGNTISFSVSATGTGLTYQWRKGNVNLIDGGNISGAATNTLTISNITQLDAFSNYNVIVYGTYSPNDTSNYVSLIVDSLPVIITQPVNQTVCEGMNVSFSILATGTGITYQWRKGTINILNGGNVSGATTSNLLISNVSLSDIASDYNVVITGSCIPNATSMNVALNINTLPNITVQPISQTVCEGTIASFSVTATGTGLTYQWRKGNVNLINNGSISGSTTSTLTLNNSSLLDIANNYNVIVSGTCLPSDTSNNVALGVNISPVVLTAISNSPVCLGDSIVISTQLISGGTYTWSGPNGFFSTSQNNAILSATVSQSGVYSVGVSQNGCNSLPSSVTVSVINCFSDLSIVKIADNMTPLIDHSIVFILTATNNGPLAATGVFVTDILQNGYTYIASKTTNGSYDASTGIWTIGNMANGESEQITITATVNSSGNYLNTATIEGNETDTNLVGNVSTIIPVPTDFFIPEGFSPNNDGVNDFFVIRGILFYPNNTLTIYNRWGIKVFDESPYVNNWGGKSMLSIQFCGDDLPVESYFYVLDLGDESKTIKGIVYLNK